MQAEQQTRQGPSVRHGQGDVPAEKLGVYSGGQVEKSGRCRALLFSSIFQGELLHQLSSVRPRKSSSRRRQPQMQGKVMHPQTFTPNPRQVKDT